MPAGKRVTIGCLRRLDARRELSDYEQKIPGDEEKRIIAKTALLGIFKQHELLTLEMCLKEALASEPSLKQLYCTLANEATFVKPSRKQQFLTRTNEDIQEEKKTLLQIANLKSKLTTLDAKIEKFSLLRNIISDPQPRLLDLELSLDNEIIRSRGMKMLIKLNCERIKDSFDYLDDVLEPNQLVALVTVDLQKSSGYDRFIKDLALSKSTPDITVINDAIHLEVERLLRPLSVLVRKMAWMYKFYTEILPKEMEYRRKFHSILDDGTISIKLTTTR